MAGIASSAGLPFGNRASGRLGHYASRLLILSIFAVVIVGVRPLPPGALEFTVPLALFAFVLVTWVLMRQHDRRLCEQCASAMPLNPAADAVRLRRRLAIVHIGSEPRFFVPYLIVLIASNFAMTTLIGRITWALIQLSMAYLIMANSSHRALQPWCPQCRGGGEEVKDAPPVLPHDDRERV